MIWGEKEVYVFVKDRFSFGLNPAYVYDFIIPENNNWIELNQVINNASVTFNVITRNLTPETRHASILVREKNNGLTDTVHVHQASQIWMNQTTIHAKAQGLDTMLYAKDYYPMGYFGYGKHLVPDESSSWIKLEDYYESCRILISADTGDQERSAEIYLSCPNGQWYDTLHIRQVVAGQEMPYLRLSQSKADVKAEGGSVSVTVSTNVEYEVVVPIEAKEWLSQIVTEGNSELRLVAFANEGTAERCADITMRGKNSDVTATLRVCQAGKGQEETKPYLTLSAKNVEVPSTPNGLYSVLVSTNVEYDVVIPAEAQDWIRQKKDDLNPDYFKIEITANESTEERCTEIILRGKNSDVTATLRVCQAGKEQEETPPYLTLGQNEADVKAEGGNVSVTVGTNVEYEVVIPTEAKGWLSWTMTESNDELRLAVTTNEGTEERCTEIILRGKNSDVTATLRVCQAGKEQEETPPYLTLGQNEADVKAEGGNVSVTVGTNVEYEVVIPTEAKGWLSWTMTESNDELRLAVTTNEGTEERCTEIILRGKNSDVTATLRVCQAGKEQEETPPYLTLGQNEADVKAEGGNVSVTVGTNVEYEVVIPTEAKEWLKQMETESAEKLQFMALANEGTTERCVDITVRGKNSDVMTTLRVCQAGKEENNIANKFNPKFAQVLQSLGYIQDATYIVEEELINITKLSIGNQRLLSLQGIEYFKALTRLECQDNLLTELDVSRNTSLTFLHCPNNRLANLDVSNNTKLTYLRCDGNKLTNLGVSNNRWLTYLNCRNNALAELDVSGCRALTELKCGGELYTKNKLITLDVSNNTALTTLDCSNNQLTNLDVSNNTELTQLSCEGNKLTNLGVSNNRWLTYLDCGNNDLTEFDVSNNTELTILNCSNNRFTNLDVSNNTELTILDCSNNRLTNLNMKNNTKLTKLNCQVNQLLVLIMSNNTELYYLNCSNNKLLVLNVSKNTQLSTLNCSSNQLKELDIRKISQAIGQRWLFEGNPGTNWSTGCTFSLYLRKDQKVYIRTTSWTFEGKTVNVDFNITE